MFSRASPLSTAGNYAVSAAPARHLPNRRRLRAVRAATWARAKAMEPEPDSEIQLRQMAKEATSLSHRDDHLAAISGLALHRRAQGRETGAPAFHGVESVLKRARLPEAPETAARSED